MAADPVATAASRSPVLSTLAAAVMEAGLPETLNGSEAAATRSHAAGRHRRRCDVGRRYTVNDANVVCGNVQTRNATVYIIDTVLMPES